MYEGMQIEDIELLQALDNIIRQGLAQQGNLNALAKRALDRFIFSGSSIILERLVQAAPICGVEEPIACVRYIFDSTVKYDRKENRFTLKQPIKAKRLLSQFRKSDMAFSDIGKLIAEEKELARKLRAEKKEEKPTYEVLQKKLKNYLGKCQKEIDDNDAESKALLNALISAVDHFLPTPQPQESQKITISE